LKDYLSLKEKVATYLNMYKEVDKLKLDAALKEKVKNKLNGYLKKMEKI